jgi:hypothetical protein
MPFAQEEEDKIKKELEEYAIQEKSLIEDVTNYASDDGIIMNEGMPQGVIGMEKEKVFHLQSCASEKCFIASQTQSSSS